ncbi:MAG: hypothetical protein RLZ98_3823 [Pseudomonadota bacterium]|jgi:chromosomal replication initiation ATPase DnaA
MSGIPNQLVFDLPHRSAQGADDFVVTGSNAAAVAVVDAWPLWQQAAIVLVGPAQSGKSHLVEVWRDRSGAPRVTADRLTEQFVAEASAARAGAVEAIDAGIADEQCLFHLLNLARETGIKLILTSRVSPGEIEDVKLPDLRSRLRALPVVSIEAPDEPLLKVLLVKLFADRQLAVDPPAINFLARHLDRTWAAAVVAVQRIDELALATHRRVTRALASEALQSLNHEKLR